jgi:hypothetical protein
MLSSEILTSCSPETKPLKRYYEWEIAIFDTSRAAAERRSLWNYISRRNS